MHITLSNMPSILIATTLCAFPSSHSAADWSSFKSLCNQYNKLILSSKKEYYASLVSSAFDKPQTSLENSEQTPTPQILVTATHHFSWHFTCRQLYFFYHRQNIQTPSFSLTSNPATSSLHSPSPPATPPNFSVFSPASESEVHKILSNCSLQARLLQLSLSQPAQVSDHPAPTDPELSCTCCCQSSQIQSHHSHPPVSTLAKYNSAH